MSQVTPVNKEEISSDSHPIYDILFILMWFLKEWFKMMFVQPELILCGWQDVKIHLLTSWQSLQLLSLIVLGIV